MFRRLTEPLPLSEASLLVLRPALNAPVLNAGFLPVGPARGAVVVFAEEWGGIGVALGIRSNESGQIAVFRNQEQIEPDVEWSMALEPAISEAERLGFLFDEDMVSSSAKGQGRAQALALWGRLMGEIELPPPPTAVNSEPAATEPINVLPPRVPLVEVPPDLGGPTPSRAAARPDTYTAAPIEEPIPEIDLKELSVGPEQTLSGGREDSQKTEPLVLTEVTTSVSAVSSAPTLSKFRATEGDVGANGAGPVSGADTAEAGANALGRIPLVRVRKEREGAKRVPFLARILSSF